MNGGVSKRRRIGGFTIVETLIVLAVTGFIFVSIVGLVAGRQNKTEFQQAINNITGQIQQTITEVQKGYFPSSTYRCNATGSISFTPNVGTQGSSQGCMFIGKVTQFAVHGTDPQQFNVFTLVGCQFKTCLNKGDIATTPAEVKPVVDQYVTDNESLENGLVAKKMTYKTGGGATQNATGAMGFLSSFGSASCGTGSDLCSGSQQVGLYAVNTTALDSDTSAVQSAISVANLVQADSVAICFESGTTTQAGTVTIGGQGQQLSVSLTIKSGSCS